MDTLAHALWSLIIFHNYKLVWLAVLFGVLPDLLSWTIYLIYKTAKGEKFGPPVLGKIPRWAFTLYGITHSVFVMGFVFIAVYVAYGFLPLFLLSWTIHILIDIPTHSRKFLPTPFLWPVSEWKFPGFNWGQKWFMITNYGLITLFILSIIF
ncbi:hypothetical protein ISS07_05275 [Candidatus Woesearchaeota archaeon]|nr:hypothetical protein [Candidatus Woesearchaeota archaeon]